MFKKLIFIWLFLLLAITTVSAEDITAPSSKVNSIHGNQLMLGVTDDANKSLMMLRTDANGYLKTTLGTALVEGTDSISSYPPRSSFVNITTNATTVVKSSSGFLLGIIVNTAGVTSSMVIYDNTAGSGTVFGTFSTTAQVYLPVNGYFGVGITAVTTGGTPANLTLVYK